MQKHISLVLGGLLSCISATAEAGRSAEWSGGITVTGQAVEANRADPSMESSLDLVFTAPAGRGSWVIYLEGSSAIESGTVADVYPGVNADTGTATLDGHNRAAQISEFKYRWDRAPGRGIVTVGLLDTAAYMDLAATANDENSQFLNAALVNNLAISFPDYTLGIVYERRSRRSLKPFAMVTGSHGIADNPDQSYEQLVQLEKQEKGVFAAGGLRYRGAAWSMELGGWRNTADHASLSDTRTTLANYGAYAVIGGHGKTVGFDLRAGYSRPKVNFSNVFASASAELDLDELTVGLGYAHASLSPEVKAPGLDAATVAEVYLRSTWAMLETTFDFQYLQNVGFNTSAPDTRVAGIRFHYPF